MSQLDLKRLVDKEASLNNIGHMSHETDFSISLIHNLAEVDSLQWNLCANPSLDSNESTTRFDPFVSYEFLSALEQSGSAIPETGWYPHHLLLKNARGDIQGVMPMYLKNHSLGEYVFDYGWADAFERAGGSYYPKLQVAVPFTPVTGRRILVRPQASQVDIETRMLEKSKDLLKINEASSLHLTFLDRATWERLGIQGFLQRIDQQFHWQNHNYTEFSDFLNTLSSKKRRNILRERRLALQNDIHIEVLSGSSITESHWDTFFAFYQETGSRKWGNPYLTREFFSLIGQSLSNHILLVLCKRNGKYIAGALNLIGSDTLFGRYWGCLEQHPYLHFEVCYYQAIEYAIRNKLSYVEAGAQGEHKLARGYTPNYTYSAHWIANESFRAAISHYLTSERNIVQEENFYLRQHSPYRNG